VATELQDMEKVVDGLIASNENKETPEKSPEISQKSNSPKKTSPFKPNCKQT